LVRPLQSGKARAIRITEQLESFADVRGDKSPGFPAGGSGATQKTRLWRVVMNLFARFVREENGQDLIEYSLLAALISIGSIAAMGTIKDAINGVFSTVSTTLTTAS
jgi:pilus assembly protein Flp/PilA